MESNPVDQSTANANYFDECTLHTLSRYQNVMETNDKHNRADASNNIIDGRSTHTNIRSICSLHNGIEFKILSSDSDSFFIQWRMERNSSISSHSSLFHVLSLFLCVRSTFCWFCCSSPHLFSSLLKQFQYGSFIRISDFLAHCDENAIYFLWNLHRTHLHHLFLHSHFERNGSSSVPIAQCGRTEHIAANYANDSRSKRWLHIGISVDGRAIVASIRNEY